VSSGRTRQWPVVSKACLEVLPVKDGALPRRAVSELDEESTHCSVLVVPIQDADAGAYLQELPRVGGATKILLKEVQKEVWRGKDRFRFWDLLADARCNLCRRGVGCGGGFPLFSLLPFLCNFLGAIHIFLGRPGRRAKGSLQQAAFMRTADGQRTVCVYIARIPISRMRFKRKKSRRQPNLSQSANGTRGLSLPQLSLFSIERHRKQQKERQRKASPVAYSSPPPDPSPRSRPHPLPLRFHPSSHISCTKEVQDRPGTQPSANKSRILKPFFSLPISFHSTTHRIFCCGFQCGQFSNRCSRICLEMHHLHYVTVRPSIHWMSGETIPRFSR